MTRTWALVPLKNLAQAKARLTPAIDAATRHALVLAMASDVLHALAGAGGIERVLLVSNEPEAGSLLGGMELPIPLEVFYSSDHEGLNRELELAAACATAQGAERALILHADLPWLNQAAVEGFIAQCPQDAVCVAPCKLGSGTNALLAPLPLPLPLVFGADSLRRFQAEAGERGLELRIFEDPGLAKDIDRPDDFKRLLSELRSHHPPGKATRHLLLSGRAEQAPGVRSA